MPQSRAHKASLRESANTSSTTSRRSNVPYTSSRKRKRNRARLRRRCKRRLRRHRRTRRRFAPPHPRRGRRSRRACSPRPREEPGLRAPRVRRLRSGPSSPRLVRAAPSLLLKRRRARSPRCSSGCAFRCPSCTIRWRACRPLCGLGRERGRHRVCTCLALGCAGVSLSVGRVGRCRGRDRRRRRMVVILRLNR